MLLWGGQTVSEMGSAVTQLALPLTAVVLLAASTFEVGLLSAAATLAFAVIALPAGALVDRRPKRGIMIACDAARLLIIGSVPVAWAAGVLTMWQLYAVALTAGVCTVFFDVAGPGLGGGLVAAFGATGAMSADALSYAISVASLAGIRYREPAPQPVAGQAAGRPSLRAEIAEGLRFVVGDPILGGAGPDRARHRDWRPPDAVDRAHRQLGGRFLGLLFAAAPDARCSAGAGT
jgi:MFS family permease